jgi:hypothetical protein
MSAFDEVINDVPLVLALDGSVLELDREDHEDRHTALAWIEKLMYHAENQEPDLFAKMLRQACLNETCRTILLQRSQEETQVVLDAIQLVSVYMYLSDIV